METVECPVCGFKARTHARTHCTPPCTWLVCTNTDCDTTYTVDAEHYF